MCDQRNPLLLSTGDAFALLFLDSPELWLAQGDSLSRSVIDEIPGFDRPFATAIAPKASILAVSTRKAGDASLQVLLIEDGHVKKTFPLAAPPVGLVFWNRSLLAALPPTGSLAGNSRFPCLQRLDESSAKWETVLEVGPPAWASAEEDRVRQEQRVANGVGTQQPTKGISPSEQLRWGSGLPVPRRDGRLWFVNIYDGSLRLLSRAGAEEWRGVLAGVERTRTSPDEARELESHSKGAVAARPGATFVARHMTPVVKRAVCFENDLLVLVRDNPGLPGGGLVVLRDRDRLVSQFTFAEGGVPTNVAVTDDGTVWFAKPWGAVSCRDLGLDVPGPPEAVVRNP